MYKPIQLANISDSKESTSKNLTQQQLNNIIKDWKNGVSEKQEDKKLEARVIKRDAAIADQDVLDYIQEAVEADRKVAYKVVDKGENRLVAQAIANEQIKLA